MVAINALALFAALSSIAVAAPHNTRSRQHNDLAARYGGDRHALPVARSNIPAHQLAARAKRACRPRNTAAATTTEAVAAASAAAAAPAESSPAPAPAPEGQAPESHDGVPEYHAPTPEQNEGNQDGGNTEQQPPAAPAQDAPQEWAPPPAQEQAPAPDMAETSNAFTPTGEFISVQDDRCGGPQPSVDSPNGREDWLNCGIESGGWEPPHVKPWDLRFVGLDHPHFAVCSEYFDIFRRHGEANGLPPTLLAAIAYQESTCQAGTSGKAGGENGLMQITHDKCQEGVDCKDPEYNIAAGARYLKDRIDNAGGNVLIALGQYNGWRTGLTVDQATAAKWQGNCHAQNNLDYLHQMVNGHLQGKDNTWQLGRWQNLADCY